MTTANLSTERSTPHKPAWGGVVALGVGIFSFVMAEFLPASVLPRISDDLGITTGAAGQMVTVTAIAAALTALLLPAILPRADRRRVMIVLTTLAIVSDLLVAIAPNFELVMLSRILLGVAFGGFWALATAVAAHLVSADHLGRALTIINTGVALATVIAVPLGAWLGEFWGWRGSFVLAAVVSAVALIAQLVTLPPVAPAQSHGIRALGQVLRSGTMLAGLFAMLLIFGGHFSGFTYIRPAAEFIAGIDAGGLALLLGTFGVANLIGAALAGPLADRALRVAVLLFPALVGGGLLVALLLGGSTVGLFIGAVLWGIGFGGTPTAMLTWGARAEPTRLEQVGGLIVTTSNVSVAIGGVVGGLLVDNVAASGPFVVGAVAVLAGAVLITSLRIRRG